MPFYDIAGLVVEIKHPTGRTEKQARPYLCKDQEGQTADMTIDVTEQRVTDAMAEHPEMNRDDWYYMLTGSDFYTQLLKFRGILLHSSCVVVDGAAYAFPQTAAPANPPTPPCGSSTLATGRICSMTTNRPFAW